MHNYIVCSCGKPQWFKLNCHFENMFITMDHFMWLDQNCIIFTKILILQKLLDQPEVTIKLHIILDVV